MIKTWAFDYHQVPGPESPDYKDVRAIQGAFSGNLDLVATLERRGFEGVFFSEHHFVGGMGPCPNLLIAALAPRTRKLKLGVMGNVLPFHQPWRLAEELAMLDYITEGRLEIGVAPGVPPEFVFINIAPEHIRPMYREVLDYIDLAHAQPVVTFKGKYFDFEEVPAHPRPRREARRRHWMTIYSEASCREAARRNYKVCTGYQTCESAAKAFAGYRDEAAKLGRRVSADDIGLRRQVLVWDTDADARALEAEHKGALQTRMQETFKPVMQRLAKANAGPSEAVKRSGVIDAAVVPSEGDKSAGKAGSAAPPSDFISADENIAGSPASVAEQIIDQCRRTGAGNLLAYHIGTLNPQQLAHHYDLWERVIPILANADVLPAAATA